MSRLIDLEKFDCVALKGIPDGYKDTFADGVLYVLNRIDELPVAEIPRWIPCSERLPENRKQVLVYARSAHYALAKYDEMLEADGTYKKQWVTFDAWKPFYTIKEVVAWMPLPEPYKERWMR